VQALALGTERRPIDGAAPTPLLPPPVQGMPLSNQPSPHVSAPQVQGTNGAASILGGHTVQQGTFLSHISSVTASPNKPNLPSRTDVTSAAIPKEHESATTTLCALPDAPAPVPVAGPGAVQLADNTSGGEASHVRQSSAEASVTGSPAALHARAAQTPLAQPLGAAPTTAGTHTMTSESSSTGGLHDPSLAATTTPAATSSALLPSAPDSMEWGQHLWGTTGAATLPDSQAASSTPTPLSVSTHTTMLPAVPKPAGLEQRVAMTPENARTASKYPLHERQALEGVEISGPVGQHGASQASATLGSGAPALAPRGPSFVAQSTPAVHAAEPVTLAAMDMASRSEQTGAASGSEGLASVSVRKQAIYNVAANADETTPTLYDGAASGHVSPYAVMDDPYSSKPPSNESSSCQPGLAKEPPTSPFAPGSVPSVPTYSHSDLEDVDIDHPFAAAALRGNTAEAQESREQQAAVSAESAVSGPAGPLRAASSSLRATVQAANTVKVRHGAGHARRHFCSVEPSAGIDVDARGIDRQRVS
jgi:hypothetical protein